MKKLFALIAVVTILSCETDAPQFDAPGGIGGSTAQFEISKDHLYVLNTDQKMGIFSLENNDVPSFLTEINLDFEDAETIFAMNDYLFFGSPSGLYIYSITNPDNPTYISKYEHITSCDPVFANDSMAYVTLRSSGGGCRQGVNELHVLDISDIRNIIPTDTISMYKPHGLTINSDSLLVICERDSGLTMFSLKDPKHPKLKTKFQDRFCVDAISITNNLISVSAQGGAFFEIENGKDIKLVKQF